MSFPDPLIDSLLSLGLLLALVATVVAWVRRSTGNHWAFASLCVALLGAFPAAAHINLPASWTGISPLMSTIGLQTGRLSLVIGSLAWGLSVVALLVRNNWHPARELGGVIPAYLGGFIGVCTTALSLWQVLRP